MLLAGFAPITCGLGGAQADGPDGMLPGSVMEGWKVFVEKQCTRCHAVWGLGGQIGPDLGRSEQRDLTAGKLAGTMWNHVPKVYSYMVQRGFDYPVISEEEMSDLFSFLFFIRYLDEPGDPVAGERALTDKGCSRCHAIEGRSREGAPDLLRWASYVNPIVWAQKMWEHAPKMEQAMQRSGIAWPELDDYDLINIMAYLRSIGGSEEKVYLLPGSAQTGARLFTERQCYTCHYPGGAGHDLASVTLPSSLAALASRMWNHSPEMTRMMEAEGVQRSALTAQEMADIIAYVISLRYQDREGDPQRGRSAWEQKQCTSCHLETPTPSSPAPAVESLGAATSPVRLADAMWNHGVTMMSRMSETGLTWPMFERDEMVDLLAYLTSLAPAEGRAPAARPQPAAPAIPAPGLESSMIEVGNTCVTAGCHPDLIAGRALHTPTAQNECDACHVQPDPKYHRYALSSTTSELCYQCHDKPLGGMQDHEPVAVDVCVACHDPHSADNLLGPKLTGNEVCFADMIDMTIALESLRPRPETRVGGLDVKRVPERPSERPAEHAPKPARPEPSASTQASDRPIPAEGGCVTADCHPGVLARRFLHGPAAQQQCTVCHTLEDQEAHRFTLLEKEPDLCFECHDPFEKATFTHGPVAVGMCTSCHDPHGSDAQFMLLESGNDLCFTCHTEMAKYVGAARVQHAAVTQTGCTACHDPHQSERAFQLKQEPSKLCLDCHETVRADIQASSVQHGAVSTERACMNCHNPHGSDLPNILAAQEIDLCLGCHDKPMDTPHGPIIDMKSRIQNNRERHGPVRESNCSGCHRPHGSKNFRLLQDPFPETFYAPFSLEAYALCFECHEEQLVLDETTTTVTGFRNGDENLHFMHVNQQKGRTCRACHYIHAGMNPKRIKDYVPFGNWMYPVNFEQTTNGGRCAPGCHVPREYDRTREIVQD